MFLPGRDLVVRKELLLIITWLERGDKDGIRITAIHNPKVFIATAGKNWGSPSVVRVYFSDVLDECNSFDVSRWFYRWWGGVTIIYSRFCWLHTLSRLDKISHDGFSQKWIFFSKIGVNWSWPKGVIAVFNSSEPSVLHWEALFCMEWPYQGLNTWGVVFTKFLQGRPCSVSR